MWCEKCKQAFGCIQCSLMLSNLPNKWSIFYILTIIFLRQKNRNSTKKRTPRHHRELYWFCYKPSILLRVCLGKASTKRIWSSSITPNLFNKYSTSWTFLCILHLSVFECEFARRFYMLKKYINVSFELAACNQESACDHILPSSGHSWPIQLIFESALFALKSHLIQNFLSLVGLFSTLQNIKKDAYRCYI